MTPYEIKKIEWAARREKMYQLYVRDGLSYNKIGLQFGIAGSVARRKVLMYAKEHGLDQPAQQR